MVWYVGPIGESVSTTTVKVFLLIDSIQFGSKPILSIGETAANNPLNGSFTIRTGVQTAGSHTVCMGVYESGGGNALLGNAFDGGVYNQFGVAEVK